MPTVTKLGSGNWPVQVRRKGHYAANTFKRRKGADAPPEGPSQDLHIARLTNRLDRNL